MRRFFIDPENVTGSTAVLTGPEARHISTVLRLSTGTAIVLFYRADFSVLSVWQISYE